MKSFLLKTMLKIRKKKLKGIRKLDKNEGEEEWRQKAIKACKELDKTIMITDEDGLALGKKKLEDMTAKELEEVLDEAIIYLSEIKLK